MLTELLRQNRPLILDGALATELERMGYALDDALWSARLLLDAPGAVRRVHLSYAEAGADLLTTATYQASLPGFRAAGHRPAEARLAFRRAVQAAAPPPDASRSWAVAGGLGPYGAFLADGSEYTGRYEVSSAALAEFHRPRIGWLSEEPIDCLAFETIPSLPETELLAEVLTEVRPLSAWFSFCCRDPAHLQDGQPLEQAVRVLSDHPQVLAVGLNCVPPALVPDALAHLRSLTRKPLLSYPNSGESFDPLTREWTGERDPAAFAASAAEWMGAGCRIVGGCCRTTPAHIAALRSLVDARLKG